MDDDLKKAIDDLKKNTPDYNPGMKFATRAEFKTLIRKNRKPGCPFMIVAGLLSLFGIGFGVYFVYTHILVAIMEGFMWVIRYSA